MYDLASRPEVVQDIRKEIKSVLADTDGVMTSSALFNMKLLDSFMRESQRFTPPFTGRSHISLAFSLNVPVAEIIHSNRLLQTVCEEAFGPERRNPYSSWCFHRHCEYGNAS